MPPKSKDNTLAKGISNFIHRQPISNSTLLWIPEDAVEGYQERIDRCVEWTISGSAVRYHREMCALVDDKPRLPFSKAMEKKIKNSFLNGFLDEESTMTLQEHFEVTMALAIWDCEQMNEEAKLCFQSANNITDDIKNLIKVTVEKDDREILKRGLLNSLTLRLTNAEMTHLDSGLIKYTKVTSLSLCGNYLTSINSEMLPPGLRLLELQANFISNLDSFTNLPPLLMYVGLSRNLLSEDSLQLSQFPNALTVLDLSENDIYYIDPLLSVLARLPNLTSLLLYGNPCSVCAAYALTTVSQLQRLRWLDNRQILPADRPVDNFVPHIDDLRSVYFSFTILRIISAPIPPKTEKGANGLFHIELTLPLLDPYMRSFLMYARCESLTEMLPGPEDSASNRTHNTMSKESVETIGHGEGESLSEETDIYMKLEPKNSLILKHYTTFESNKVSWAKIMNFQEPTVKLFCPDLRALINTFKSIITLKLVYTLTIPVKKPDKKTEMAKFKPPPSEFRVVIATIKCALRNPDWSQNFQHFHWDDSLETNDAIHWGDADLSAVQYQQAAVKTPKGKQESDFKADKQAVPENLTCHFGFGIETLHP